MADSKITDLTELTSPVAADVLAIVDDTVGTPITKKITYSNLGIPANTTHRTGDGSDHADVATNTVHSTGDGSDHSAVAANTLKVTNATHTGDVTGATALTIADEAVTLAKMAHIATDSFLGRDTAGTGDVEVLSAATAKTVLDIAQGDLTQEINAQTGTSYTLVDSDHGKLVTMSNASAITLNINTGLRSDFACSILQKGAGQITVAGTATINNIDTANKSEGQWALFSVSHLGSDVYFTQGRLVT